MKFLFAVRSETAKLRHTPFWGLHCVMPLLGAVLFVLYYLLYPDTDGYQKLRLILELTATFFPILISIVVGLAITLEEKASHFHILLSAPGRRKILLAKLFVLYGFGAAALAALFGLFWLGTAITGLSGAVPAKLMIQAVLGIAYGSLVLYILHLFLNLKFGLGISLFWGVFESLQAILYSNIKLHGNGRYIPFSWTVNWIQDVMNDELAEHMAEWILTAILTACILAVVMEWFAHWEGRKNEA